MNPVSPFVQAHQALLGVNPLVVGFSDSLADATNDKITATDLISSAKKGLRPLDRTLDLFQPQPHREELTQQLNDLLASMASLQPESADLGGVAEAHKQMDVPMPAVPDLVKPRMSDAERLVTVIAGLLGGGATGVAQATAAAQRGAEHRAQRENADAERRFEQEMSVAKAKREAAKNRLEVEKLLVDQQDAESRKEFNRQMAKLKVDELGVRERLRQLGEEGGLRVEKLTNLIQDLAADGDGWTEADRAQIQSSISEIAAEYGISPDAIRRQLGALPKTRDSKVLENIWFKAGSQFAEFVGRIPIKVDPSVARGKFLILKQQFERGGVEAEEVKSEMSAWTTRLSRIAGLLSSGNPDEIELAARAIRAEKAKEKFMLAEFRASNNEPAVQAQQAILDLLTRLESLAGNKKGAVNKIVPSVEKNVRLGQTPLPKDFGIVEPENPMSGEYDR